MSFNWWMHRTGIVLDMSEIEAGTVQKFLEEDVVLKFHEPERDLFGGVKPDRKKWPLKIYP